MAVEKKSHGISPVVSGGSIIINVRPVFSHDSKYLLCCCGAVIRVLSIASGECVQELKGHKKPITGLISNPQNPLQVLSCGLDQAIIKWDIEDGVLLKRYQVDRPLLALYPLTSTESTLTVLAVRQAPKEKKGISQLVKFELPRHPRGPLHPQLVVGEVPKQANRIAVGYNGSYVAYGEGQTLNINLLQADGQRSYTLPKTETQVEHFKSRQEAEHITCVTCHPTQSCVATGLFTGRIICWWGFEGENAKPAMSQTHWHPLPLLDLCYSTEGSLLLSGGHETVLAVWQQGTNQRRFLPRLGAPISLIAVSKNNALYAVCHADNGIQVAGSNLEIVQHFQGLTRSFLSSTLVPAAPAGLLLDPRTGALVLNGRPGHLQFYQLSSHKQLYNLDIVGQNYVSPVEVDQPRTVTHVEQAAFDSTGDWLATVERWDDRVNTPEIRLKFWAYDVQAQQYILNTKVDKPHSQKICTLKVRPRSPSADPVDVMAVTTSLDAKFKLWGLRDDTDIYRSNVCWKCESVGFYRKQPAGGADFSVDGSLLAVAFGKTLTLWDPETNALQTTLSPGDGEDVRAVLFGTGPHSQFLMSTTASRLISWNMLTCAAHWSISLGVKVLTTDPLTGYVAAFTNSKALQVFTPQSSKPVFSMKGVSTTPVLGALFVPHSNKDTPDRCLPWQSKAQLYYLNGDQELLTLSMEDEAKKTSEVHLQKVAHDVPQTMFSQLMAHRRKRQQAAVGQAQETKKSDAFLQNILSTPAHVLPPIGTLCMPFLQSLMGKQQKKPERDAASDADDSDSDSDSESSKMDASGSQSESDMETDVPVPVTGISSSSSTSQARSHTVTQDTPAVVEDRGALYKQLTAETFYWLR